MYKRLDTAIDTKPEKLASKKELLLRVLLKQMTAEECAEKLIMKPEDIKKQVQRLSFVVDQTLSDDAGGGDEELLAKLKTTTEEKASLLKTIDRLLDENLKYKAKLAK